MVIFVIKCIIGAVLALAFIVGVVVLVYKLARNDWLF